MFAIWKWEYWLDPLRATFLIIDDNFIDWFSCCSTIWTSISIATLRLKNSKKTNFIFVVHRNRFNNFNRFTFHFNQPISRILLLHFRFKLKIPHQTAVLQDFLGSYYIVNLKFSWITEIEISQFILWHSSLVTSCISNTKQSVSSNWFPMNNTEQQQFILFQL
jgi:hypothetical protein